MQDNKLEYDPLNISFRKARRRFGIFVGWFFSLVAISIVLTVLLYLLFAVFFNTDNERKMEKEIKVYKEFFEKADPDEELLGDVLSGLQIKDNDIYGQVFHAHAPGLDPMANLSCHFASDTIPDYRIYSYTRDKADTLVRVASRVDEAFRRIVESLVDPGFVMPPMELPLKDISYTQVGASMGSKINPFYRAFVNHGGIDLIAGRGTPVFATADGQVSVSRSTNGNLGNFISISHAGGYETVYGHLSERLVQAGQTVRRGQKIGYVGMSGHAYAPHLHYEIIKNGENLDPIDFFYASVGPEEYANMLYMSINTMQSLD